MAACSSEAYVSRGTTSMTRVSIRSSTSAHQRERWRQQQRSLGQRSPQIKQPRQLLLAHAGLLENTLDRLPQPGNGAPGFALIALKGDVEADHMTMLADRDRIRPRQVGRGMVAELPDSDALHVVTM